MTSKGKKVRLGARSIDEPSLLTELSDVQKRIETWGDFQRGNCFKTVAFERRSSSMTNLRAPTTPFS